MKENTVVLEEYARKKSRTKGNVRRYATIALFLTPFILAFIIFFIVPLFYGIWISLTNFRLSKPGSETFLGTTWYQVLLNPNFTSDMPKIREGKNFYFITFWRSFRHSFIFSIIMVPIAIIVPLALAILVNTKPPAFKAFRTIIYMPSIVPLTAAGSIFVLLFADYGLLNGWFGTTTRWFSETWFILGPGGGKDPFDFVVAKAWIPIWLMCFWGGWGGNFIILNAGLQNVPKNLYEAADIDGCSKWKQTIHITLAGIKPQLVLCLFTTIIGYLGLYGQNFVLTSGGPTNILNATTSTQPGGNLTSTAIYFLQDIVANNANFKESLYGMGAAASLIFALLVGIISGIQMFCTRDKKTGFKISEGYYKWNRTR